MINLAHILKTKIIKTDYSGYYNQSYIHEADIAILAIFHLHYDKHINDKSFNAYCAQYRNSTLIRKVNTYHNRITDEWYNDTSSFEPIMDSYFKKCKGVDLSLDVILGYLNKLLNRNKNYCIDHLYFNYFGQIISELQSPNDIVFSEFNKSLSFPSYEQLDNNGLLSSGYCCRDCDGCLGEYKRSAYLSYIGYHWKEKIETHIKKELNSKKTKDALLNKNNKLLTF